MGGLAKGLLVAPDGAPIVLRTRRLAEAAGAVCFLVGDHPAYRELGLPVLADDPSATGPLAGLLSLLRTAAGGYALALACDMPQLTGDLIGRLASAPPSAVVAPRRRHRGEPEKGWLWEPLCARYDTDRVLPIAERFAAEGGRRLQLLLDAAGAEPLALAPDDDHALVDWDETEHLPRGAVRGTGPS
jgi:molybdopterin-guanine dinucleotide biosynthesis protein A